MFPLLLKIAAAFTICAGMLHVAIGPHTDVMLAAHLGASVLDDPVLVGQNRFYGVIFAGFGALLWLSARDLTRYRAVLLWVCGAFFLGGVTRLVSVATHGAPSPQI